MFPIVVLNGYIKKIDKFDLNSIKWNSIDINCNHNMLSNYWSNIPNNYGIKIGSVNKLVPNLSKKSKYILLHYKNLQLYLLYKVRRIRKFKQLDWLKTYIDFNTELILKQFWLLKRFFVRWWITAFMVKQWKI